MKTKYLILSGVMAVVVGFTASVQAIPITGTVVIQGGTTLTPQGSLLGTATGVAAINTGSVLAGAESYFGTAGAAVVTFNGFTIQSGLVSISPLWTFTIGATTYSFDLTGMVVNTYNASFLDIGGTGILHITGFDATPGTWSYQITSTDPKGVSGIFSYQSSNTAIPDGGMTVMLLGAALSGLYVFKRKTLA